ncbi:MAG: TlpA family protein disulfide reductase [Bacteroides sp.]|nr:TlpA family protein disulfide reductase [Bacteroides sp.]
MKAILLSILFFSPVAMIVNGKNDPTNEEYLRKVLSNLEKIESASYYTLSEAWQPGDSIPVYATRHFTQEYKNPKDTTIGASYVTFNCEDTTLFDLGYNGDIKATTYHEHKGVMIDDFTTRDLPFRLLTPPFFNYTKSILNYILTTQDNITVELEERKDEYYLKLSIDEDRQVEFFGKAYYMPENPYLFGDTRSQYELWISKANDLPYKKRREMAHSISAQLCYDAVFNNLDIEDFNLYAYFPDGYEIRRYGEKREEQPPVSALVGEKAPLWTLPDAQEQSVSLADLPGKVVLMEFTGIGCGPCRMAIPFLNELKERFAAGELSVITLESWVKNLRSIQVYTDKNGIQYPTVCATEEIIKEYQTHTLPSLYWMRTVQSERC